MPAIAPTEPARALRPTPVFDALLFQLRELRGPQAEISRFKQRCRRVIRMYAANPGHPAVYARYYARAKLLRGSSTADAAAWVACRYASEQRRWRSNDARVSLIILRELRLIIRYMRARNLALQPVIADVLGEYAEAAE
jgi:hypothetical protein